MNKTEVMIISGIISSILFVFFSYLLFFLTPFIIILKIFYFPFTFENVHPDDFGILLIPLIYGAVWGFLIGVGISYFILRRI